jgi:hypothetical protein
MSPLVAAVIVLSVIAVICSIGFCWAAWNRGNQAALIADLELTIREAEDETKRARRDLARVRANHDTAVEIAIQQRDSIAEMSADYETLAIKHTRTDGYLLELMLGGRILPSLDDEVDLMIPTWPIAQAPIYAALKGESLGNGAGLVVLPAPTLAEAVAR